MALKRKQSHSEGHVSKLRPSDDVIDSDEIDSDIELASDTPSSPSSPPSSPSHMHMAKKLLLQLGESNQSIQQISDKIQREAAYIARKINHQIAQSTQVQSQTFHKGHRLPPTCVTLQHSPNPQYAFSGGKDCAIIRWNLETGQKDVYPGKRKSFHCGGHFEQVLAVTYSETDSLLISSGADHLIRLWDVRAPSDKCIDTLRGHAGPVTGVRTEFTGQKNLYSCSSDKTIRVWSLSMRAYLQTYSGHTDQVQSMDLLVKERPISISPDRTVRLWRGGHDSTHYVFHANAPGEVHGAGFDSVAQLHAHRFATGGIDGSVALWSSQYKRPIAVVGNAHGGSVGAMCAVRNSDLLFTGSNDGVVMGWEAKGGADETGGGSKKSNLVSGSLRSVCRLEVGVGFVGGLDVSEDGRLLVAMVGKEPRLGRWECEKSAKNGLHVVRLDNEYNKK